jgi:hypothetical protein
MSEQYPGGFITKTAPTVTTTSAQGMWTLSQQAGYQKQGIWPGIAVLDAQFNYVTMLLHGDGTNGAQNNTFLDSSSNAFSITRNGNTTQGSFSPYGSNWSNYFDGTSAYLAAPSNSAFTLGTGNFTIEMWYNPSVSYASGNAYLFDMGSNGTRIQLYLNTVYFLPVAGSSIQSSTGVGMTVGQWTHVAVVRSGSTMTLYVNGTSAGSVTNSSNLTDTLFRIGSAGYTGDYFTGYISNVRVVKGTAVYTSSFTPSTTPLTAITNTSLLTCQSNRFIDNSSNAFTLTVGGTPSVQRFNPFGTSNAYSTSVIGGSGYFDKSGDYLDGPTNSAFAFGTGDFTISAWVYILNGTSSQIIWTNQTTSSANAPNLVFFILSNNVCIANTNTAHIASSGTIANNSWNYVGVTKSSGTYTFYINGSTSGTTSSIGTDNITENACHIGYGNYGSNYYFGGYIADLRVIKGSAVTPTVPTAPVGTVTNTQLLLNMTNGAIYDNAMMNDLETVGNAQISTSVKKYGTGSLYFDGSGDWLTTPYGPTQNFGTGNFTIECWAYLNSLSASYYVPMGTWGSGTSDEWLIQIRNDGYIRFLTTAGSTFYSASITTATWYHIAVVRNSSTINIYVNGTSVGSYTCTNSLGSVSKTLYIGTQAGTWDWNGYIDDLRITNGYARYTTTFTPPTAAFPNIGPN